MNVFTEIIDYINSIKIESEKISDNRKSVLSNLSLYIETKLKSNQAVNLLFICTHNSRRSHLAQIWAQAAAHYYDLSNVNCFSGGTEVTAFNNRLIKPLMYAGFKIEQTDQTQNPVFNISYSPNRESIKAFSKKFDNKTNPDKNFAVIMTCSEADETCPFIPGADVRFAISYDDPKIADNTYKEEDVYKERFKQIAGEMIFVFSNVKLI